MGSPEVCLCQRLCLDVYSGQDMQYCDLHISAFTHKHTDFNAVRLYSGLNLALFN